ncbi:MAG: CdaR family protein [Actinomycetota bacterium]|nr:CdaR family protein [Actinomycetota bacterium]
MKPNAITGIFTRNLWLKTAAVLIALVLWAFVIFRNQVEVNINVEPVFRNVPAGLMVAETRPRSVSVTIIGSANLLGRLQSTDVQFMINLKDAGPGKIFVRAKSDRIKRPQHVGVVSVTPSGIWVVLENAKPGPQEMPRDFR